MHDSVQVVQTLWTKPFSKEGDRSRNDRRVGGFKGKQNFFNCWALSCLQAKKYFKHVVLYADDQARHWLVDLIDLPYDKVYPIDEAVHSYSHDLWAVPKLFTYLHQKKPFIHVDGDLIMLSPIKRIDFDKPIIAEFLDDSTSVSKETYNKALEFMKKNGYYIPEEVLESLARHKKYHAANMGFFGGTEIDFFHSYAKKALTFIDKNLDKLDREGFDTSFFNCIFEQVLVYCLAEENDIPMTYIYDSSEAEHAEAILSELRKLVINSTYPFIHFISNYKQSSYISDWVTGMLKEDYQTYYDRIYFLLKEKKL